MAASPSGFALRQSGFCQANEVDCGATENPFRICCPAASFCPSQYNKNCCPSTTNCTLSLLRDPQCANRTWDLFDNNGYFCCQPGLTGYAARLTDSNGCAAPGYAFRSGEVALPLISAGQGSLPSSTTSFSTTQISSSTPSSSTTPPAVEPSEPLSSAAKTGIGVGASVGGILVLGAIAWMAFRRFGNKRAGPLSPEQHLAQEQYPNQEQYPGEEQYLGQKPHPSQGQYIRQEQYIGQGEKKPHNELQGRELPAEMDSGPGPAELDGGPNHRVR